MLDPNLTEITKPRSNFSVEQISAEAYRALSARIDALNAMNPSSLFSNKATTNPVFCNTADTYFSVTQGSEIILFALQQSEVKLPFDEFIFATRNTPVRAHARALVKEIHFTEEASLEEGLKALLVNVCGDGSVAFCFSADCLKLASAIQNINGLCTHISQGPSTLDKTVSLESFYLSYLARTEGFSPEQCSVFNLSSRVGLVRLQEHFQFNEQKMACFIADEEARTKKIWRLDSTKKYLASTREKLDLGHKNHRHLEIGAGFFPDADEMADSLGEDGKIFIIERESAILRKFENNSSKNLRMKTGATFAVDLTRDSLERYKERFDSIRIVDFFENIPDEAALHQFATNVLALLKPGGRLVIAEKDLTHLSVSNKEVSDACSLFKSMFGFGWNSGPGGNLERAFLNAGFVFVTDESTLPNNTVATRKIKGKSLGTFLNWTRLDNFHSFVESRLGEPADRLRYTFDIQEIVFTKPRAD